MIYKLKFIPSALKEWEKIDSTVKEQFKKKLKEREYSKFCVTFLIAYASDR